MARRQHTVRPPEVTGLVSRRDQLSPQPVRNLSGRLRCRHGVFWGPDWIGYDTLGRAWVAPTACDRSSSEVARGCQPPPPPHVRRSIDMPLPMLRPMALGQQETGSAKARLRNPRGRQSSRVSRGATSGGSGKMGCQCSSICNSLTVTPLIISEGTRAPSQGPRRGRCRMAGWVQAAVRSGS
jgi:hypothetical protein